jgi:hypothetical protein
VEEQLLLPIIFLIFSLVFPALVILEEVALAPPVLLRQVVRALDMVMVVAQGMLVLVVLAMARAVRARVVQLLWSGKK